MYFIGTLWKYDFTLIWYHWFQGVATYEIMWRIHLAHQTSAMIREWWLSHLKVADDIRMFRGSNSNPHKNFYLLCIVKMQEKYSKESQRNPRIINSPSSKMKIWLGVNQSLLMIALMVWKSWILDWWRIRTSWCAAICNQSVR